MGRPKCNCAEWAELGPYFCPVHGTTNTYRHGPTRRDDMTVKNTKPVLPDAEIKRLKECLHSVVASLVNGNYVTALRLARTGMYGGSVNNPLDVNRLGEAAGRRHYGMDQR